MQILNAGYCFQPYSCRLTPPGKGLDRDRKKSGWPFSPLYRNIAFSVLLNPQLKQILAFHPVALKCSCQFQAFSMFQTACSWYCHVLYGVFCSQTTPRRTVGEGAGANASTPLSRTNRLQSCVNLGESPRPLGKRIIMDPPSQEGEENRDPDFRTPNLCSRPSFR